MAHAICVLCLSECSQLANQLAVEEISDNENSEENVAADVMDLLKRELPVKFLLSNILQIPEETFQSFVKGFGDPVLWNICCNYCSYLVKDAKSVFQQIMILENRYNKLQNDLRTTISLSIKSEKNVDAGSDEVQNAVRSYFKNNEMDFEIVSDQSETSLEKTQNDKIENSLSVSGEGSNKLMKRHECKICSSSFKFKSGLQCHMLLHGQNLPHICDICNKGFTRPGRLARHKELHLQKGPYLCDICSKDYDSKEKLMAHRKKHKKIHPNYHEKFKQSGQIKVISDETESSVEKTQDDTIAKRDKRSSGSVSGKVTDIQLQTDEEDEDINRSQLLRSDFGDHTPLEETNRDPISDSEIPETQSEEVEKADETRHEEILEGSVSVSDFNEQVITAIKNISEQYGNNKDNRNRNSDVNEPNQQVPKEPAKSDFENNKEESMLTPEENTYESRAEQIKHDELGEDSASVLNEQVTKKLSLKELAANPPADAKQPQRSKCVVCGGNYTSKYILARHMQSVHGIGKSFKCKKCAEFFATAKESNIHKLVSCKGFPLTACNLPQSQIIPFTGKQPAAVGDFLLQKRTAELGEANSPKKFREISVTDLQAEVSSGSTIEEELSGNSAVLDENYKCGLCGKEFEDSETFRKHKIEEQQTNKMHYCKFCKREFPSESALRAHFICIQQENAEGKKIILFSCRKPDVEQSSWNLRPTDRILLNQKTSFDKCEICGKKFWGNGLLIKHKQEEHGIGNTYRKILPRISVSGILIPNKLKNSHVKEKTRETEMSTTISPIPTTLASTIPKTLSPGSPESIYKCDHCSKCFEFMVELRKHKSSCNSKFPCPICKKMFSSLFNLNFHMDLNHKEKNTKPKKTVTLIIKQPTVSTPIQQRPGRKSIMNVKSEEYVVGENEENSERDNEEVEVSYACDICDKTFPKENQLRAHRTSHVERKKHVCKICEKPFPSPQSLEYHLEIRHSEKELKEHYVQEGNEKDHKCEVCCKYFALTAILEKHREIHERESREKKDTTCETCGANFSSIRNHNIHLKIHFSDPDILKDHLKTFDCEMCSEKFTRSKCLAIHKAEFHTTKWRSVCNICGKRFVSKISLDYHLKLHAGDKPFKCDVCERSYASEYTLSQHKKKHVTGMVNKKYECETCGMSFWSLTALRSHNRSRHTGERPYACELCDKAFTSVAVLKKHILTHTREKPYKCKVCGKDFREVSSARKHEKSHRNDNEEPVDFNCDICGKSCRGRMGLIFHKRRHQEGILECKTCGMSFPNPWKLHSHINKSHPEQKEFICEMCGKSFVKHQSLKNHQKNHEHENLQYKCNICDAVFPTKVSVRVHSRRHANPHECTTCKKSFSTPHYLTRHMMKKLHGPYINSSAESLWPCHICEKTLKHPEGLKLHMKIHAGIKNYKCTLCPKAFLLNQTLKHHMRVHTGEKPYCCEVCGKSFTWYVSFKKHKATHTGGRPKHLSCETCGKFYPSGTLLRNHIRSHTGEKPFQCNICDKSYALATSLKIHKRTHEPEKPYKCKICEKSFTQAYTLTLHMRRHQ